MKRISVFIASVLFCAILHAQDLTILHLNDTHSHIEPERSGRNKGTGGVIEQAAYIDSVRCADGKGNVILLHAGDFSQGTSYFTELDGNIEIDILDAMAFDAVCLGNHEFDNGFDDLARRLKRLKVPVVCANYDFSSTPLKDLVKPYVIVTKGYKRIGVIGLLTDVSSVVDADIAASMKYMHPAETAERYAAQLKAEGCDLVVCLTHLGYEGESYTDLELAAATRNVDIIVGGHSHTWLGDLAKTKNLGGKDVVIVTDGKWGLNIGRLAVHFQKNRLTELYDSLEDEGVFRTGGGWFPYPAYKDREGWNALLGKDAAELIIRKGESNLDFQWQNVPATAYLAYERTGERTVMENPLKANRLALVSLALAELAEGKGRFMDQIVNGVWHISHMPSWVLSAHLPRQRSRRALPDPMEQLIDLGSGALGAELSAMVYFFKDEFDSIDPVIARVAKEAVKKQIFVPYLNPDEQRANWWLAYDITNNTLNNWNPWCNADVILSFLLIEDDPEILSRALRQSAKSVDKFLAYVKTDGACEEGPAYWGHAAGKLYDYLQIMYDASDGRFSIFDDPQIKSMGEYISRSFVQDGWVVNFADASAYLSYPPALIYNYGKAVGSAEMKDFAVYNLGNKEKARFNYAKPVVWTDIFRCLESLKYMSEMNSRVDELNDRLASGEDFTSIRAQLRRYVPSFTWYPQTEFCYMLDGNWFVAAKGGHNNESHNHNDIGTFILYVDGVPLFVDAGVGTYTKKTFSGERYTIWSMCSDWHNLPVINGITQKNGRSYHSASVKAAAGRSSKHFSLEIAGAYPDNSECHSWHRDYKLSSGALVVTDTYSLKRRNAADVENFLVQGSVYMAGEKTPSGYVVKKDEVAVCNMHVTMTLSYPSGLTPSVEVMNLDDKRLTEVWGNSLRRISFRSASDAPEKGKYVFKIKRVL